ncbi:ATP-dependent Clp protease proteolytic subunit [Escherichia coli]
MARLCKEIIQSIIIIFLINFPASAGDERKSIIRYDESKQTVQFISTLTENSVNRLMVFRETHPFDTIIITSPGGDFDAGVALGNFVNDNNLTIIVERYCNSSCTIAFFSANIENRYMMKDSILGLHNVSIESKARNSDDTYITVRQLTIFAEQLSTKVGVLFALYAANGIPPELLVEVSKVRGNEVVRLTPEQLFELGSIIH